MLLYIVTWQKSIHAVTEKSTLIYHSFFMTMIFKRMHEKWHRTEMLAFNYTNTSVVKTCKISLIQGWLLK